MNFDHHIRDVSALGLGPSFQRLWRLYLCYCEAAFLEGHVSDVQMILAKPRWRPSNRQLEPEREPAPARRRLYTTSTASTA